MQINRTRRTAGLFAALLAALGPSRAAAGTRGGSVTINGSVSAFYAVDAVGFNDHNGAAAELRGQSALISLGTATADLTRPVGGSLTLRLRSNAAYALSVSARSASGPLDAVAFGVHSLRPSGDGARTRPEAVTRSSVLEPFGGDPMERDLESPRVATLADLGPARNVVLTGPAICRGGSLQSDNNALLVDLTFAVSPKAMRRTGPFAVEVEYTLGRP